MTKVEGLGWKEACSEGFHGGNVGLRLRVHDIMKKIKKKESEKVSRNYLSSQRI